MGKILGFGIKKCEKIKLLNLNFQVWIKLLSTIILLDAATWNIVLFCSIEKIARYQILIIPLKVCDRYFISYREDYENPSWKFFSNGHNLMNFINQYNNHILQTKCNLEI